MKYSIFTPFVGESWIFPLQQAFPIFQEKIAPVLKEEKKYKKVFPIDRLVLRAFKETPYHDVRVVILGQYPFNNGLATGLAFDTPKRSMAPALRNIIKEITNDVGAFSGDGNVLSHLEHLPPQGVLLLNSSLTAPEGKAGAHSVIWREFIEEVVKCLQRRENIVWVLWGESVSHFKELINSRSHKVVEGANPSPFTYRDFRDQKFFSKINALVKGSPINW